jgi:hypothetical protein
MAMTTSQLRAAWGPACQGTKVSLAEAYRHLDLCFKRWSYQIRPGVTGSYNCRKITGGSGYSLHAFGPGGVYTFWTGVRVTMALAVDCNWDRNPYSKKLITDMPIGMINDITNLRTNNGQQVWGWGGHYRTNRDSMHFEVVCSPASLATGIRGGSSQLPTPAPKPPEDEEDEMNIVHDQIINKHWLQGGSWRSEVTQQDSDAWAFMGVPRKATNDQRFLDMYYRGVADTKAVGIAAWNSQLILQGDCDPPHGKPG